MRRAVSLGVIVVLGCVGCGYGGSGAIGLGQAVHGQREAEQRQADQGHGNPYTGRLSHVTPARLLPRDSCPLSTEIIWPVLNGWFVGDHHRQTGVWGGGDLDHSSIGRFAILRDNFIRGTQHVNTVDVAGAGPLRITRAPLGRKVVTSAQRRAKLWFKSRRGVHGVLHLRSDTVTITHG
jgi:hypothetical protein